jgi:putative ABC transport system permease protein
MLAHYLGTAINSFKRNVILTALTIATISIGIGGAMSTFTVYYAMSGDPIPWKSSRLFVPQLDSLGPKARSKSDEPPDMLSYQDARALMQFPAGEHHAAMYQTLMTVTPDDPDQAQFATSARATGADFFRMFDIPFKSGRPWSVADDESRADFVVINSKLAARVFRDADPVGKSIVLNARRYRVVGVLKPWNPTPRFYDLTGDSLAQSDSVFLPFNTAIDRQMSTIGHMECENDPGVGWQSLLSSNCVWLQYWVQLDSPAAARRYAQLLREYASGQQRSGRFTWLPMTRLRDVPQWLTYKQVIPTQVRVVMLVGFGFLLVCLANAVGLMVAKFAGRVADLAIRRALGATRLDLFFQCLSETALIGILGGAAGLIMAAAGAALERSVVDENLARVTHLDLLLVVITLVLAELATLGAGLYPAWRASRIEPALQLAIR